MRALLESAKVLMLDMASTIVFLLVMTLTKNVALSVALGIGFGIAEIGWELIRKRPIDLMQGLSLFLVIASGIATLITKNPKFIMIKPSLIYVIVGVVMLRPGWMNRYLPERAIEIVPDLGYGFGFVWAGLMFVTAVVSLVSALNMSLIEWAAFMSAFALATKLGLFGVQYGVMRMIGRRRWLAAHPQGVPA